jgi:hypothetical protein
MAMVMRSVKYACVVTAVRIVCASQRMKSRTVNAE